MRSGQPTDPRSEPGRQPLPRGKVVRDASSATAHERAVPDVVQHRGEHEFVVGAVADRQVAACSA